MMFTIENGVAINLENSTGPEDGITYKFESYANLDFFDGEIITPVDP